MKNLRLNNIRYIEGNGLHQNRSLHSNSYNILWGQKRPTTLNVKKNGILLKTKRSFSWIDLEIIIETLEKQVLN